MMTPEDVDWVVVPKMADDLSPELFADIEEPEDVALSPNGDFVVYSLRTPYCRAKEKVVASLWIAETGKVDSSRQLTGGTFNDHTPTFSIDGNYIAFLSDRANVGKASDIYLLPLNGGEAFRLTPQSTEKPISSYRWCPKGSEIAYLKAEEDSDDRKQKVKDKDDCKVFGEDWDIDRLHLVSTKTKKVTILETGGANISQFDWGSTGERIVFTTTSTPELDDVAFGGADVKIIDVRSQAVQFICSLKNTPRCLVWGAQGIVWIQGVDETTLICAQGVFGVMSVDSKSAVHLSYGQTNCAQGLQNCSGKAVVHVIKGLSDQLHILGASSVLSEDDCRFFYWDAVLKEQDSIIAVIKSKTGVPAEVFSIINGKSCQLTNHGKAMADLEIGTSQLIQETTADGLPMDGLYCIPQGLKAQFDNRKPLPTLVCVHGGPYWRATDAFAVDFFSPSWFMAQGYLVLVPNYRGGMGHGNRYATTIMDNAAASYQDIVSLVKKGIDDGYVDKSRTAIFGWSQGGFLSYLAVTRDSEFHWTAAIPGAGVSEWTSMAMTSDVPTMEGALSGNLPWVADRHFIGDRKSSPIYHMDQITTPMLILHGEDDARVPVSQAISFHRGMRARNLPCDMAIYPREGHGNFPGFERTHYIDMLVRIQKFLKHHIG